MQTSRYRSGIYNLSGTFNVFILAGIAGYQFGFRLDSMQYCIMNPCIADCIRPMSGIFEIYVSAYRYASPHGIIMNGCGSEGVSGEGLSTIMDELAVYDATVTINSYQGQIAQENLLIAFTPIFRVQSTGTENVSVSIISCNIKKDPPLTNQGVGYVNRTNTTLYNIGSIIDAPFVGGGAVLKTL